MEMNKKILFVDACVRNDSRTRTLCQYYLEQCGKEADVETICLREVNLLPLSEDMLLDRMRDIEKEHFTSEQYSYAKSFAQADRIVIGAPYWDCSFPSILKVFLEHICVNKITFTYSKEGRPVPLCRAKKLIYITTAGGFIGNQNSGEQYLRDLCDMYGIEEMEVFRAEGLDIQGNDITVQLEQAKTKIRDSFQV